MSSKQKRNSGFSLVELMVAVVIGLLGTLIMFQVFAMSESQKRTTASGGDAQQNAATALYTIERELRNAAYGYAPLIQLGRPVYGWDVPNNQIRPARIFRPVLITPGAGSDTIELSYSNFEGVTHAVPLGSDWNPNGTTMAISNGSGMKAGDVLIVCDPNVPEATAPCIQVQITNKTSVDDLVIAPSPATFLRGTETVATVFNPAGGIRAALTGNIGARTIPAPYLAGKTTDPHTEVYNIGFVTDTARSYSVQNGRLMITGDDGVPQEYADGIVSIRAQYGLDTDLNGSVDKWVNPRGNTGQAFSSFTPNALAAEFDISNETTTAASWARVRAIRVGIVTRSNNIEKTAVESRTSIPLWVNPAGPSDAAPSFSLAATDDHRYRYTVFDSIIPFRNMIWNPHRL